VNSRYLPVTKVSLSVVHCQMTPCDLLGAICGVLRFNFHHTFEMFAVRPIVTPDQIRKKCEAAFADSNGNFL
jgi:hypothetical protein